MNSKNIIWGLGAGFVAISVVLFVSCVIKKFPVCRWHGPQWMAVIMIVLIFVLVGIMNNDK